MVRAQNFAVYKRYRNAPITVRQTVRNGVKIAPPVKRRKKKSPIRAFFEKMLNIVKLGLFVGAAVCPVTCVFVVEWMLLD
ncbi:MAG: hypothetical protein IJ519_00265 [Clostridia bacterium]|nr:hypothetical protein [Clostridia bacterium]